MRGRASRVSDSGRPPKPLYRFLRAAYFQATRLKHELGGEQLAVKAVSKKFGVGGRKTLVATLIAATLKNAATKRVTKLAAACSYAARRNWSPQRFELELFRQGISQLALKNGGAAKASVSPPSRA